MSGSEAVLAELEELAARYDALDMARVIERLPDQIEIALAQGLPSGLSRGYDRVAIAGMGGSSLPCDLLLDCFAGGFAAPIGIVRSYEVPPGGGGRTLLVASSFSGNTEETLAAVEDPPAGSDVVVLCAGGRLADLAGERGLPLIRIDRSREPEGMQPRCAVGYSVTFLALLLHRCGVLARDPRPALSGVSTFLRGLDVRAAAEDTARWLGDRVPVIHTDAMHEQSIARVARIKFNENAKRPALSNAIPEANHNEMVGFTLPIARFGVLYLHDPTSHPRVRVRHRTMQEIFEAQGLDHVAFREWELPGASRIERVFAGVVFADWCSWARALLDGIDPTPVDLVETFKRKLPPMQRSRS